MKLFLTLILLFTTAHCAEVVKPKLPLPLNRPDTVEMWIQGYAAAIAPEKLDIVRYELDKLDVTKFDTGQWVIYITTYDSVVNYGKELMSAVKSVRVSHYIQSKDYTNLQAELKGVIPDDRIEKLIGYMQGTVKPTPKIDTTFISWNGYSKMWYYDLLKDPMPPQEENSFIAINDLKLDYKDLYDKYFNSHTGKTKIIWNWQIVKENYIRQEIPNFVSRYKDKIHSHMTGGDYFNSFDYNPPYDNFFEAIRQNIALIYAGDINAVIELCVAYPESVNGTIWLNTMLPYLDIQGLAVWGYHKKTQDQRLTLTISKDKLDKLAPDKYKILIGQFTGIDLERAKIAEELGFSAIQFQENPL